MFLFTKWLQLNINTRHKIAGQFNIPKRGSTEVVNDAVVSDGYKVQEIEAALNIDALQTFLGTDETDMMKLWERLLDKIENPEMYEAKYAKPIESIEVMNEYPKKGGRPKKHE